MIFINPGTEPVKNTSLENAIANMKVLVADIDSKHKIDCLYQADNNYGDGRYCFILLDYDNYTFHEIQMPGAPLSKVRYMKEEGQNIMDFPRLYIDDGSWIWCIAVDILKREFSMGVPSEVIDELKSEIERLRCEHPPCYTPNDDPYPLCKGNSGIDCMQCCLYENYSDGGDSDVL